MLPKSRAPFKKRVRAQLPCAPHRQLSYHSHSKCHRQGDDRNLGWLEGRTRCPQRNSCPILWVSVKEVFFPPWAPMINAELTSDFRRKDNVTESQLSLGDSGDGALLCGQRPASQRNRVVVTVTLPLHSEEVVPTSKGTQAPEFSPGSVRVASRKAQESSVPPSTLVCHLF